MLLLLQQDEGSSGTPPKMSVVVQIDWYVTPLAGSHWRRFAGSNPRNSADWIFKDAFSSKLHDAVIHLFCPMQTSICLKIDGGRASTPTPWGRNASRLLIRWWNIKACLQRPDWNWGSIRSLLTTYGRDTMQPDGVWTSGLVGSGRVALNQSVSDSRWSAVDRRGTGFWLTVG